MTPGLIGTTQDRKPDHSPLWHHAYRFDRLCDWNGGAGRGRKLGQKRKLGPGPTKPGGGETHDSGKTNTLRAIR